MHNWLYIYLQEKSCATHIVDGSELLLMPFAVIATYALTLTVPASELPTNTTSSEFRVTLYTENFTA